MAPNAQDKGETQKAQASASSASFAGEPLATIIVGVIQKRFHVPTSLLTHESRFFRAALTGRFKEAREKTVTLKEEDPEIFEFFVYWLKHKRFPDTEHDNDKALLDKWESPQGWELPVANPDHFVELYILADKYDIKHLRNDSVSGLLHLLKHHRESNLPSLDKVDKAFQLLPSKSPLCRLLVDSVCKWASNDFDFEEHNSMPFIYAVCSRLVQLKNDCWKKGMSFSINIDNFLEK